MTYGIVGLGRFGSALAMDLASAGAEIVVMDKNGYIHTDDPQPCLTGYSKSHCQSSNRRAWDYS